MKRLLALAALVGVAAVVPTTLAAPSKAHAKKAHTTRHYRGTGGSPCRMTDPVV